MSTALLVALMLVILGIAELLDRTRKLASAEAIQELREELKRLKDDVTELMGEVRGLDCYKPPTERLMAAE